MTVQKVPSRVRRAAVGVSSALLIATCMSATSSAGGTASKLTRLQFSTTMALPGVELTPGAYRFEVANPHTSADAVLVTSQATRKVHFLGIVQRVERPRSLPANQAITVGEAPAGEPVPITAWYPVGHRSGYRFVYE